MEQETKNASLAGTEIPLSCSYDEILEAKHQTESNVYKTVCE